jgi:hypothetical protein
MKQTDSSIIMVRNVCVLTSAFMIVYLFFTRSWSAIIGTKQPKVNQSPQQWRGRYTGTRICRFLVVGNIFRLQTCMNSLVKVPPYSKLNFQGKIFFTQNWCNITLKLLGKSVHSYKSRSKRSHTTSSNKRNLQDRTRLLQNGTPGNWGPIKPLVIFHKSKWMLHYHFSK